VIRYGWLHLDGYAGRTKQRIAILDVRPLTVTIRAITRTKLGGRDRWLEPGCTTTVRRFAVSFEETEPEPTDAA